MAERYLNAEDISKMTGKKTTWAYELMRKLNSELEKDGYIICRGRIPANYFYKRMGLELQDTK